MSGAVTPTSMESKSNSASPQVRPLHYPERRAVVVKHAPLRSVSNTVVPGQTVDPSIPGAHMGQKALLAKKFAKAQGSTVSPTDAIQSPCTKKLAGAKQRRFAKAAPSNLSARFSAVGGGDENQAP